MDLISEAKLGNIAGEKGFNFIYLEKDYFLTVLLFYLKDVEGIVFKGGTALNKIFFHHLRLSEDLDFTATSPLSGIKDKIEEIVKGDKNHFIKVAYENETKSFVRAKVFYKSYFNRDAFVSIDLNRKSSIHLKTMRKEVHNFYGLKFEINVLNFTELAAEKFRAAITRNKPRDYFDLYFILQKHKIDIALAKRKLKEAGEKFDTERIFRNANKIYSNWDEDIGKLTNEKLDFVSCIKFLKSRIK